MIINYEQKQLTRLAILSDIHGNLPALEAVIADMQQFTPDHVIVAGDLINGVPFDAEVMARVVSLCWTAVRGNHEFYLLDYGTAREKEGMRRSPSPAWLNETLKDWYAYIAAMPDQLKLYYRNAPAVFLTHGLPNDPFEAVSRITPDRVVAHWLDHVKQTTYISGHYHLSVERQIDRWHMINPGPVGAVMDGTHDACYVLLDARGDHWEAMFRRVKYDFAQVEAAFAHYRLDEILGVEGWLKYEQVRRARPTMNAFKHWMKVVHVGERWTYKLAHEFLLFPLETIWDLIGEAYQINPEIPLPPPILPGTMTEK